MTDDRKAYMAERRRLRRAAVEEQEWRANLKRYGLTPEQARSLYAKQGGLCAICHGPCTKTRLGRLCVDHDHLTGQVRGLLCIDCNAALGKFKDDPSLLRRAAEYLERKES